MFLMKIGNHNQLQSLAQRLTDMYIHEDPFVLRAAIIEVLQNTLQHSDGHFGLLITRTDIIVASLPRESFHKKYSLGLKIYGGIQILRKGELFLAHIEVHQVCLNQLDIEQALESCSID